MLESTVANQLQVHALAFLPPEYQVHVRQPWVDRLYRWSKQRQLVGVYPGHAQGIRFAFAAAVRIRQQNTNSELLMLQKYLC